MPDWQSASQLSPLIVLPSSQTSPRSTVPLPHVWFDVQVLLHMSGMHLPETQSPFALHGVPSMHLPLNVLPSSQTSPKSMMLLPHTSFVQFGEQPSPGARLPSSHCSPGSITPLPQPSILQSC